MAPNYSLYLVTDSTPALLPAHQTLTNVVQQALRGGAVSIVQLRDKHASDAEIAAQARALLSVTRPRGVPLLINDRVGVAVEVGCEGVHLGQDDMDVKSARALLGPDRIIGISARTPSEAVAACAAGADYLGIGPVFPTKTKSDAAAALGSSGLASILAALAAAGYGHVPTVAIGGINASNATSVLSATAGIPQCRPLAGLAVVSAIVSSPRLAEAAARLLSTVLTARIPAVVGAISRANPVSHNMTNLVVQNLAANIALAVGASPIMANDPREAPDLAALGGALVVNTGSVSAAGLEAWVSAVAEYNKAGRPVVLDPVGAGATAIRRAAITKLLSSGSFAVIKGNASEMLAVDAAIHSNDSSSSSSKDVVGQQRGVDSSTTLSPSHLSALAASIARRAHCIAVITGVIDVVSNGRRTIRLANGHPLLAAMTGSGCSLGTVISAAIAAVTTNTTSNNTAVAQNEALEAVVAAVVLFNVAAEMAAARPEVRGPGTFVPALIDELAAISRASAEGDTRWLALVKVDVVADEESAQEDPDSLRDVMS